LREYRWPSLGVTFWESPADNKGALFEHKSLVFEAKCVKNPIIIENPQIVNFRCEAKTVKNQNREYSYKCALKKHFEHTDLLIVDFKQNLKM